jgi:hypothetical protein
VILRIIPFVIASFLLAAHFLRNGSLLFALVSILVPLLLLIRKWWILTALQVFCYAAAAVWVYTAVLIVQERMMYARPWGVAVLILGSVALFTIAAAALLNSRAVKDKYPS